MHLHLPVPAEWRQQETAGRRIIMPHTSDDIRITVYPMEPMPPPVDGAFSSWLLARVHHDIPNGAMLVLRKSVEETTQLGWPATVMDIQIVTRGTPKRLLEQRVTTCYRFLEYCVLAETRTRNLALLIQLSAPLRAMFTEGRPDWSGSDTSLKRLLQGVER
jgi:hypothetical protein